MKKILLFAACVLLATAACKKDKKDDSNTPPAPQTYEDRVSGNWDLKAVSYESEMPNVQDPTGPPIAISGNGKDVTGRFVLTQNPNIIDYNLSFKAEVDLLNTGFPIEVPIAFGSNGTWTTTSDGSKLFVTDENGEELLFDVELNEPDKQIFSSTLSQTFNIGLPLTLEVDIVMTFERAN